MVAYAFYFTTCITIATNKSVVTKLQRVIYKSAGTNAMAMRAIQEQIDGPGCGRRRVRQGMPTLVACT